MEVPIWHYLGSSQSPLNHMHFVINFLAVISH